MPFKDQTSKSCDHSAEELERYVLGRIVAGEELMQVEQHLVSCPVCAGRADTMTDSIAALIRALRQFETEEERGSIG